MLRDAPLPADWTVEDGLTAYLEENGFDRAHYDAPRTPASLLGLRFSVPNPPRHARAIRLHDLHHVATGFGTDLAGEAEISAWEARLGLRTLGFYTGSIVVGGVLMGAVVAPRRTWRAWRAARAEGARGSLFQHRGHAYEDLLGLRIGELRAILGLPAAGLQVGPRGLHSTAPRPGGGGA